jgi:uncharacterized membrane protein
MLFAGWAMAQTPGKIRVLYVGDSGLTAGAMALACGIPPHWGAGFQEWKYYEQFWNQTLDWLGSR